MKTVRTPLLLFAVLYVCFVVFVWISADALPPRVATHFGAGGEPNGWMSRHSYLQFTLIFGFAFPLFPTLLASLLYFLPHDCINIPNRDYWLAPERRGQTLGFFSRHVTWLACLMLCFMSAIHYQVVHANRIAVPRLPGSWLFAAAGCFVAAMVIWFCRLFLYFRAPRPAS